MSRRATAVLHHAEVMATPWAGVHVTLVDSARHFGRHWHDHHGVGLIERGAQSSASGRGPVQAEAGQVITCNPGEVHDGRPLHSQSRRWRMLYLDPGVLGRSTCLQGVSAAADLVLARPVIGDDVSLVRAAHRLFQRLASWHARCDSAAALACDEAWTRLDARLLCRHVAVPASVDAAPDAAVAALARVRERLADDPCEAPSLAALAELAGLSRFQLMRSFAKTHGLTPHAWLLQQRAEVARRLIRGGASLAAAAADAGFADQSHMTRTFGAHFGFTPGAWQQAVAGRR